MKRMKYHNQVKFMPGIQGWLNMQKSIRIIYQSHRQKKKKHTITFIDSGKAFNKIQFTKKKSQQSSNTSVLP